MSARLFVPATRVPPGTTKVTIEGDAHRYVGRVLRMRVGEGFVIFDGEGAEIDATLESITATEAQISLGQRRKLDPPHARVTLLQGVPKGERMDWVLQKTTELGIACLVPVMTTRVVVKLDAEAAKAKQRRWQAIVQEAARQCGRADVPQVQAPCSLAQALATLPAAERFVLWEEPGGQPFVQSLSGLARARTAMDAQEPLHVQLLVGPEGGFAAEEVALARAHDFVPVTLGPRVLRTETAAVVAVTLAQAAVGGFA
ncbi:MAG: 16S rRNA (uracil(1498)-N(3))-methyltransferase [Deltaproteobacteria bacterium]|nr:16S rRNA (uracil(1498)-N(3))-methyltransferase [Deltaproteobacteria bacterium]